MKKYVKVIGKIVKWYAVADVCCLAVIGASSILDQKRKCPNDSYTETMGNVLEDTELRFKKYFTE